MRISVTPPARTSFTAADVVFICLLGVGLLVLSYARLLGDLESPAFNIQIVRTALVDPLWRTRLGLNIALFVLALLALHLAWAWACWLLGRLSAITFPKAGYSRRQWTFAWYLPSVAWLLIANATFFPHSSLGEPYSAPMQARIAGAPPFALATVIMLAAMATVLLLAIRRQANRKVAWTIVGATLVATASGFMWKSSPSAAARPEVPNIIVLGIDSLRPDAVTPATTPHIHAFMSEAVELADAVTPLARTFPSWVSILTGRHPHTTSAYMNLLPTQMIHAGTTLPELLREHGYRTYYAIDETRFSNIDASYGFDRTATPAIGGADFVLTWFADTPLSNLVVNTRLGSWLFPHVHANRAAHVTYDPDSFMQRVRREFDFDRQPIFLALHLTLPHWPFTWATSPLNEEPNEANIGALYEAAVHRADQQFGDLMELLRKRGALDNALVFVLSDHGEALGRPDDLMPDVFPEDSDASAGAQKWGHGTSVFSPHQYQVLLGVRAYGHASPLVPHAAILHEPVSLLDVTPTILDMLHIEAKEPSDGRSLASLLKSGAGSRQHSSGRIRFTESEYNPQGFSMDKFTPSAMAAAARVYRLDPATDRITVRADLVDWILSTRQYAALLDGSFAAALPQTGGGGPYQLFYQPRPRNEDTSEEARLKEALEKRFGIQFSGLTIELKPRS